MKAAKVVLLLSVLILITPVAGTPGTHTPAQDELSRLVSSYLHLQLCVTTAHDNLQNVALADRYLNAVSMLSDGMAEKGLTGNDINPVLAEAMEDLRHLQVTDGDTYMDWLGRNFSEQRCEEHYKLAMELHGRLITEN